MILNLFKSKKENNPSGGTQYHDVTVKEVIRETEDAVSIIFDNPGNAIQYQAGQYLTLILDIDGEEMRRSYSLCTSPDYESEIAVTIKKIEGGKVSNYLLEQLKAGDQVKIMSPAGNFTTSFKKENQRTFVLFAGGSGITPLISILKSALVKEPNSNIILVYQNRNEDSIIFKKTITDLEEKFKSRLKVWHILSKPSDTWKGEKGRISADFTREVFASANIDPGEVSVFLCGPDGMMDTIETVLDELGIDKKNTHKESFYGSGSKIKEKNATRDTDRSAMESTVSIHLDGEDHEIVVNSDEFILEKALDADINMPFSCQGGVCTTCRGKLLSGEVRMEEPDGLSDEEIEDGYILTCVSHPVSKDLKIRIE
jgi:ring-1,2-phenylacetyl-CoA epoxidase subunit PaaE